MMRSRGALGGVRGGHAQEGRWDTHDLLSLPHKPLGRGNWQALRGSLLAPQCSFLRADILFALRRSKVSVPLLDPPCQPFPWTLIIPWSALVLAFWAFGGGCLSIWLDAHGRQELSLLSQSLA